MRRVTCLWCAVDVMHAVMHEVIHVVICDAMHVVMRDVVHVVMRDVMHVVMRDVMHVVMRDVMPCVDLVLISFGNCYIYYVALYHSLCDTASPIQNKKTAGSSGSIILCDGPRLPAGSACVCYFCL